MFYVTGPEAEGYTGANGVYVSPGVGAPARVQRDAVRALIGATALVVLEGGEGWPECQAEVDIADLAGVPVIGAASWRTLTA